MIVNTVKTLIIGLSEVSSLPFYNSKPGLNKLIVNIVFNLSEIHHYINYLSILLNQKRDDYYNRNYWINIENVMDYFNAKIAESGQNLRNIKAYKFS